MSNLNTKDYTEDVLASDFTCDAEATSPKGGACTYHIPIGRVNVFTDGVELVVREPQVPGKHGTIDAYATLESWRNRMNDKKCSTGAGPCPPAHTTTAISQCNGRSFPTLRTYRSLATPPAFLDNACPWDLP